MTAATATPREDFVSIQCLRGMAALGVVCFHIFLNKAVSGFGDGASFGKWGVDVFFVISGFIMWRVTRGRETHPGLFLAKRAWRIYPLYWIVLAVWIASKLWISSQPHGEVTPETTLLSVLLVPHFHLFHQGMVWPILETGWTLQLELFFYAVFAVALGVRNETARFWLVVGTLSALAAIGLLAPPSHAVAIAYTSPLLLEFCAGMALAATADRWRAIPSSLALALIAAGVAGAVAATVWETPESARVFAYGVPALLLVAGGLGLEDRLGGVWVVALRQLGDASYSLYLTHVIAISAVGLAWSRLGLPAAPDPRALVFVPLCLAGSIALALASHRFVERPLLRVPPFERRKADDRTLKPKAAAG